MEIAYSVNGVPIRLTEERWEHILDNHEEMTDRADDVLDVLAHPEWITRGNRGTLSLGEVLVVLGISVCITRKSRVRTDSSSQPI